MVKLDRQLYRLSAVIAGLCLNFQKCVAFENPELKERQDKLINDLNKSLSELRQLNEDIIKFQKSNDKAS